MWLDSREKGTVVFLSFWLSLETNPEDSGLSPCHRSPTLAPLLGGFLTRPSWYRYPPLLGDQSIVHIHHALVESPIHSVNGYFSGTYQGQALF